MIDKQPSLDIWYHGLVMAPGHPEILYAGANGPDGNVLKTTDAGATWTPLAGAQFPLVHFGAIAVSSADPNTVYVAVRQDKSGGTPGGVYQSTDGGQHFTNITPAAFGAVFASDVVIDPSNPTILYAGIVNAVSAGRNGVYRIDVSGASPVWTQFQTGIRWGNTVGSYLQLALAPSNPQVVYATIFDPTNSSTNPALERFRSGDGGANWKSLQLPAAGSDYRDWHTVLAVSPSDPDLIFINGDEPHFIRGVVNSASPNNPLPVVFNTIYKLEDPTQAAFDATGALLLLGDRGIQRSTDFNAATPTFGPKQGNLETALFYRIAANPLNPNLVFGVAQDQTALNVRTTAGVAWQKLDVGSEVGTVLIDPTNPSIVYNLSPKENTS